MSGVTKLGTMDITHSETRKLNTAGIAEAPFEQAGEEAESAAVSGMAA